MPYRALALATFVAPLTAVPLAAQAAAGGGCRPALGFVIRKVELNYPGVPDKVTPRTRPAYIRLVDSLRSASAHTADDAACEEVLQGYTAFFRDGHLGVRRSAAAIADTTAAGIRAHFAAWPTRTVDEAALRHALGARGAKHDPVEGIWETSDGAYRLAIVRDSGAAPAFTAVVLRADGVWWTPGQVKATLRPAGQSEYTSRYYQQNHTARRLTAVLARNVLRFSNGIALLRQYPAAADPVDPAAYAASLNTQVALRALSPRTLLLQLPSFGDQQGREVDSVLRANRALLDTTPNLIIDLRGNGGGSDYVYAPVLPLIYTNTIRGINSSIYATDDNIAKFEQLLSYPDFPAEQKPRIQELVDTLRQHRGQLVRRPDDVTAFDRVLPFPRRVVVLTDRGCASSCEELVLAARQSRKVTLMGEHTAGVLDYANVTSLEAPDGFVLYYPTSRSQRLPADPVDPDGIAPAVRIPATEPFPVAWAQRWLEGRP